VAVAKKIVREFDFERDTKNTRRFAESETDAHPVAVGTLYLKNDALSELGATPERVRVTIEAL